MDSVNSAKPQPLSSEQLYSLAVVTIVLEAGANPQSTLSELYLICLGFCACCIVRFIVGFTGCVAVLMGFSVCQLENNKWSPAVLQTED